MKPKTYRIKRGSFIYESDIETAQYYIMEVARASLNTVAIMLRQLYAEKYYDVFNRISGDGSKAVETTVYANKGSKYAHMNIGVPQSFPGKVVDGFYTFFHERGTSHEPQRTVLKQVVQDNIRNIAEIEKRYFAMLNGDQSTVDSIINEDTMEEAG